MSVAAEALSRPPASRRYRTRRRDHGVPEVMVIGLLLSRRSLLPLIEGTCAGVTAAGAGAARLVLGGFLTTRGLFAFDFQRDIDELVFLTADEFALAGPVQQLMGRHTVTLSLANGVLEEAGVDAGVPHDEGVAVEQALGGHRRAHHVLGG